MDAEPATEGSTELERLRSEVSDLKKQLAEVTESKVTGSEVTRSDINTEIQKDLEKQLSDLESENMTLKDAMKVKDLEVTRLLAELEVAKSDSLTAQSEAEKLRKENLELEDYLMKAKSDVAQLKLQLDDLAADSPRAEKIHELQQSERSLKEKCQVCE